jgi:phosphinothricin acetyltransferase
MAPEQRADVLETQVEVRTARPSDLDTIAEIYNREVTGGTSTFDTEVWTRERALEWLKAHDPGAYPILVAEEEGEVVGWASVSPWSDRGAYARTVEGSLFVREGHRRRGVGRALHAALVESARAAGHGVLIARIESGNTASRELLLSNGFTSVGVMHAVGEKFGRLLDVELFEMRLD